MYYCPCCSNILLQHTRGSETYWFCRNCWQEMPVFSWNKSNQLVEAVTGESSAILEKRRTLNNTVYLNKQLKSITGWIGLQDLPA
ncbi:MAG: hypothetical protein KME21_05225 [Desmonostoc vinosum HA7617-LM4]|nr:hypothetical protein [Desmonostoc vinosum HA7617-LM4]